MIQLHVLLLFSCFGAMPGAASRVNRPVREVDLSMNAGGEKRKAPLQEGLTVPLGCLLCRPHRGATLPGEAGWQGVNPS